MKQIVGAEARRDYRLWVRFADGAEGEVDLSDLAGHGVFEAWEDPSAFQNVTIDPESHTVTWPGGMDLCPDSLYEEVTGQPVLDRRVPSA